MVGGGELDVVAGVVDETGAGVGSGGCLSDDFWGCRRGSDRTLRVTRGSAGFSGGARGMVGAGLSRDIGAEEVGKRGGEEFCDGLELTVFKMRDRSSKSGMEEVEEEEAGGSEEGGDCTGGGCE